MVSALWEHYRVGFMIAFDENFFEGEERDSFYIEGEMKRAWAAEMEVLVEVDRICNKHGIRYFADSGTLLGAVRHNGFIPWDDDIDIAMLREDYLKFISVAKKELKKQMVCLNIYDYDEWVEPFGRVVNGVAGVELTEEHLKEYHGCPYSVGVDIFILDNMPPTEASFDVIHELAEWAYSIRELVNIKEKQKEMIEDFVDNKDIDEKIESQLKQFESYCNVKINREKNIQNQLLRIMDGLYAMHDVDESDEVVNMAVARRGYYGFAGRKKEWYRESIELPFENITVPVPIEFYKVVQRLYGENYFEPVKKWHFHNYPFYKDNKRKFKEACRDIWIINSRLEKLDEFMNEQKKEKVVK